MILILYFPIMKDFYFKKRKVSYLVHYVPDFILATSVKAVRSVDEK